MNLPGLKNIRKIYGFTMRDLAKRLNVTANAVNLWESGGVDVPEHRLDELAEFFKIDKQLFLKENHDVKDLMLIEIARAEFKIDEYKYLIKDDSNSIDEIIEDATINLTFRAKEGESQYYILKDLLSKIVEAYSKIPFEEYDEFDCFIRDLTNDISGDTEKWKKLSIAYYSLLEDEEMDFWGKDYSLKCDVEDLLKKQIKENIEQIYKRKMCEEGKYIPCWKE
jgi:transcriptional regulator with XRE-family HTH domain